MWDPGDPCPHCGDRSGLKFNGGDIYCLLCRKYVDSIPARHVIGAIETGGGLRAEPMHTPACITGSDPDCWCQLPT